MVAAELSLEEAGFVFTSSTAYTDPEHWHQAAAKVRAEDSVHWVDHPKFNPFWAITRHTDVMEIELHNEDFLNEPRGTIGSKEADARRASGDLPRISALVFMDGEHHKKHRDLAASWFRPSNLRRLQSRLDQLSEQAVEKMVQAGGEIDFAAELAVEYPLQVILAMMGLPESDYPRMLKLTQELFGAEDPELGRDQGDHLTGLQETILDFFSYFTGITADRQANSTEDFCSVVANAEIDGAPIAVEDQLGLYIIAATAGHDTTSHSMAGGMQALCEHPEQFARLQADPSLISTAVDEMIRWTSPVKHFARTAARDYELGGKTIKEGQDVLLSYWSANRDEDVFTDPFTFDVGRRPNNHLAFGFGVHFCLGATLAKMELASLFGALIPRLESVELASPGALSRSSFVSGYKHLPIRYRMKT